MQADLGRLTEIFNATEDPEIRDIILSLRITITGAMNEVAALEAQNRGLGKNLQFSPPNYGGLPLPR